MTVWRSYEEGGHAEYDEESNYDQYVESVAAYTFSMQVNWG